MVGREVAEAVLTNGECMGGELIVLVCTKGNNCRSAYQKNRFVLRTFHFKWLVGNSYALSSEGVEHNSPQPAPLLLNCKGEACTV